MYSLKSSLRHFNQLIRINCSKAICSSNIIASTSQESNYKPSFTAIKLTNRKLIRVYGEDSIIYLQSLLTNDVRQLLYSDLTSRRNSIYAFILSAVGKVLCDVLIYSGRVLSEGEFWMELDGSIAPNVRRLLMGYSIRRDISVEIANDITPWLILPRSENDYFGLQEIVSDDIKLVHDPRLPHLGYRFLTRLGGEKIENVRKYIPQDTASLVEGSLSDYQKYRYQLGVNEGVGDVKDAHHNPFECNGDYLNAVSISKGLYTLDQLTSKVYGGQSRLSKKGRRRIMPIEFLCSEKELMEKQTPPYTVITTEKPKITGVLLNSKGRYGLATFNSKNIFQISHLVHAQSGIRIRTWQPDWWPKDRHPFMIDPKYYPQLIAHSYKI